MSYPKTFIDGLNNQQIDAVMSTEGYVRVIAGAGSGKTKALTNRYAYIVKALGIDPSNILCVTFTNKAAQEMKKRVRKIIGDGYDTGLITTYHGFCVRVLRADINRFHYPRNFIILDEEDQKSILREIYEELNMSLKNDTFNQILRAISGYKLNPEYVRILGDLNHTINPEESDTFMQRVILMYLKKQKKVYGLDFDDLINFTFVLFEDFPEVLEKWQIKLHYVQVDEFQDSSSRQFALVDMLSQKNKNLFVVGDPDQTIYEWRGAKPEYIVNFDSTFPSCKTIILNQNYRSTPEVLAVGNSLIKKNELRIDKDMITQNQTGLKVTHFHAKSEEEEAKWITDRIDFIVKNSSLKYSDIAILYRAHYLSRYIEQGLIKAGIEYTVYGGVKFFQRKEIKDALAYLRLISQGDDLSFLRVINTPKRMIGKERVSFIKQKADYENLTLYEAFKNHINDSIFEKTQARNFFETIEQLKDNRTSMSVSDLLQNVLEATGYENYIREDGDQERLDNLSELTASIVNYEQNAGEEVSLADYLSQIALFTDGDREQSKNSVKLLTVHISKGLEFPCVFLCGMTEGIFPSSRSIEDKKKRGLEEERRIAYVAITRAMKELYITDSEGVNNYGRTKYPSRFIFDIMDGLYERVGHIDDGLLHEAKEYIEMSQSFINETRDLNEKKAINNGSDNKFIRGEVVSHPVFGLGVIEKVLDDSYLIKFDKVESVKPISHTFDGLKRN